MEMIRTALDNNAFGFGDRNYIHKEGVAKGSKSGKNFACTYTRKWDEDLLKARVKPLLENLHADRTTVCFEP